MGEQLEFEGADLPEALARARESLGIADSAEDPAYEILDEGRRGFLGVGGRGVRIRVQAPRGGAAAAAEPSEAGEEAARLRDFLQRFMSVSPFEIQFKVTEEPDRIRVDLDGADGDLLVERRGEGLNALQVLLGRIVGRSGSDKAVFVDCGDFRRSREEELAEIALLAAEKVKKLREPQSLSLMNPYDRRLVHLALKDDPDVETRSDGEGFLKRVTIHPRPR